MDRQFRLHIPAVLRVISVTLGPSEQRSGELTVNELPGLQTLSTHHSKQQLEASDQQTGFMSRNKLI